MLLLIVTLLLTTPIHCIAASNNKIQAKLCLFLIFMRFWPHFEETNNADKFNGLSRAKCKNPASVHCHTHCHMWFRVFGSRFMHLNLSSMSFMCQFGHLHVITPWSFYACASYARSIPTDVIVLT